MALFRSLSRLGYLPSTTAAVRVDRGGARRFYSRRLRTVQMAIALFATFVFAIGPTSEWTAGDADAYRMSSVAIIIIGLTVNWRLLRRGLLLDRDRIVIRNLLYFRSVPLDEVVQFTASRRYGLSLHPGLQVSLRNGLNLYANVFSNTPVDDKDAGTREAAELNAYLERRRGDRDRVVLVVPEWQLSGNVWACRTWLLVPTLLLLALLVLLVTTVIDPAAVNS